MENNQFFAFVACYFVLVFVKLIYIGFGSCNI